MQPNHQVPNYFQKYQVPIAYPKRIPMCPKVIKYPRQVRTSNYNPSIHQTLNTIYQKPIFAQINKVKPNTSFATFHNITFINLNKDVSLYRISWAPCTHGQGTNGDPSIHTKPFLSFKNIPRFKNRHLSHLFQNSSFRQKHVKRKVENQGKSSNIKRCA